MPPSKSFFKKLKKFKFEILIKLISLIITNLFLCLFSLFYIYTFGFIRNIEDSIDWKHQLPFLTIEITVIVAFSIFTIYSAYKAHFFLDKDSIKKTYRKLQLIWIFLVFFVVIILLQFYIVSDEISNLMLDDFYKGFRDYEINETSSKFLDYIQTNYKCCGLDGPNDWENNQLYNSHLILPKSCCIKELKNCDKIALSYQKGCVFILFDWVSSHNCYFYILWTLLLFLSILLHLMLKFIINEKTKKKKTSIFKSVLNNSESENLMKTNQSLINYQNSFKKCNNKKIQIGFPLNDLNCSNKFSRFSQIKYSKVEPNLCSENNENVELTCHLDSKQLNQLENQRIFNQVNSLMLSKKAQSFDNCIENYDKKNLIHKNSINSITETIVKENENVKKKSDLDPIKSTCENYFKSLLFDLIFKFDNLIELINQSKLCTNCNNNLIKVFQEKTMIKSNILTLGDKNIYQYKPDNQIKVKKKKKSSSKKNLEVESSDIFKKEYNERYFILKEVE